MEPDVWDEAGRLRILVTGASGFVGVPLCERLSADGHDLWALSRTGAGGGAHGIDLVGETIGSLGDPLSEEIIVWEPEVVVNLAWSGIPDYGLELSRANLEDHLAFHQELLKLDSVVRVIVAGTGSEYGATSGECEEDLRTTPTTHLGWAKQAIRDHLDLLAEEANFDVVWLRIFFAYGPGQRSGGLIPSLLRDATAGRSTDLRNPDAAKDFVYVDDVAEGFRRAVRSEVPGGVYNLGSGTLTSLGTIRRIVDAATGSAGGVTRPDLGADVISEEARRTEGFASTTKLADVFDWVPSTTLDEGVRRTWEALR